MSQNKSVTNLGTHKASKGFSAIDNNVYLTLGHGSEHGVQRRSVIRDKPDLSHATLRLPLKNESLVLPTQVMYPWKQISSKCLKSYATHLIPTLIISTCVWGGHWGALLIHQSHIWSLDKLIIGLRLGTVLLSSCLTTFVSIHRLKPIQTYHEVETLLVKLGEVPGHSVQSHMLVFQTEPLPKFKFDPVLETEH